MQNLELSLNEIFSTLGSQKTFNRPADRQALNENFFSEMVFDSRKASKNSIFLCIPGERVDGHDFIEDVSRAGAKLVIGSNEAKISAASQKFPQTVFITIASPLEALQKLATFYRKKFNIPVIGLTGSSGKTTTKDLMASIYQPSNSALITEGTLNNHWGVPQMVMRLRTSHKVAVFEMGTSGFGEIESLSSICQPNIGFITTIGAGHLETLKNEDGVLRAKRELFDWVLRHSKSQALIFNLDDSRLEKLYRELNALKQKDLKLFTLSQKIKSCDFTLETAEALGFEDRYGWRYKFKTPWGDLAGKLPLPGAHNLANAMAAAALALASQTASPAEITTGLAKPQISKLRSDLFRLNSGAVVYDDSYNANPTSVSALFEAAKTIRANNKSGLRKTIAAVGDMLELGPNSAELHRAMGGRAAQSGVDVLLATGNFAEAWVEGFQREKTSGVARNFKSQPELVAALREEMKRNSKETLILVKGSRGAKMDQIVAQIRDSGV